MSFQYYFNKVYLLFLKNFKTGYGCYGYGKLGITYDNLCQGENQIFSSDWNISVGVHSDNSGGRLGVLRSVRIDGSRLERTLHGLRVLRGHLIGIHLWGRNVLGVFWRCCVVPIDLELCHSKQISLLLHFNFFDITSDLLPRYFSEVCPIEGVKGCSLSILDQCNRCSHSSQSEWILNKDSWRVKLDPS